MKTTVSRILAVFLLSLASLVFAFGYTVTSPTNLDFSLDEPQEFLNINAGGRITGGYIDAGERFTNVSANTTQAIVGGTQGFSGLEATLAVNAYHAVTGGYQNFQGQSPRALLKAEGGYAGGVMSLYGNAFVRATAVNAFESGAVILYGNASFQAYESRTIGPNAILEMYDQSVLAVGEPPASNGYPGKGVGLTLTNFTATGGTAIEGFANSGVVFPVQGFARFPGTLKGQLSISKNGPGTLGLSGSNSHALTAADEGTILLENPNALGTTATGAGKAGPLGTINLGGLTAGANGFFLEGGTLENGTLTIGQTMQITHGLASAVIAGSGNVTKIFEGRGILRGANTYTGGTTISAGTLSVENTTGSGTGTGSVTIASGATLAGSGRVSGPVNSSGRIAPSPLLTLGSSLALGGSAVTEFSLAGTSRGVANGHAVLHVVGALTMGGTLKVTLANGFEPAPSATFDLLDWGSASGSFATLDLPTLPHGRFWDTSALSTTGTLKVLDGRVEAGFDPSANELIYALGIQADDKLLIGGEFTTMKGMARPYAARIAADGTLDAFNPQPSRGVITNSVEEDGSVILAGDFTMVAGTPRNRIARVSASGVLDATFNPNVNAVIRPVAIQPDGRIVIGGHFTSVGGTPRNRVARLNADGSLDASFNPNANEAVFGMALLPDGGSIVVGNFTTMGGAAHSRIARLSASGAVDNTFNASLDNLVRAVVVQPDGKIIVAGDFALVNGAARSRLARLNADGSHDATFNVSADATVLSLALQTDGRLVYAGAFMQSLGAPRASIARVDSANVLDSGFNPGADAPVEGIAIQADGRVLVAGDFTTIGGIARNRIARLLNDATTSALHVTSPTRIEWLRGGASPEVVSVMFDVSTDNGATYQRVGPGTRIAGGWELTGVSIPAVGKVRARARVMTGHNNGSSSLLESVADYPGNFVVTGNGAAIENGSSSPSAVNHTDFGPVVANEMSFTRTFTITNGGVGALRIGAVSLTGATTEFAVTAAPSAVVAPGASTTVQVTFTPKTLGVRPAQLSLANDDPLRNPFSFAIQGTGAPSNDTRLSGLTVTNVFALTPAFAPTTQGYDASRYATSPVPTVAATFTAIQTATISVNGSTPTLMSSGTPVSLSLQPRLNSVLVNVTAEDGVATRTYEIVIDNRSTSDDLVDSTFNAEIAGGVVEAILVQPDGKTVIGGSFTSVKGIARSYIARLNADGTLDAAFDPRPDSNVVSLGLDSANRILIGGRFTSFRPNGGAVVSRRWAARLNGDGTVESGFDPQPSDYALAFTTQADGKILMGGWFSSIHNGAATVERRGIARFHPDGSFDATYLPTPNGAPSQIYTIALEPDGSIVVGGAFTTIGGASRQNLARLRQDGTADPGFDPKANQPIYSILRQPDGRLLIAGMFTALTPTGGSAQARRYVARLNVDGTLDSTFDVAPTNWVLGMALQADGKVILGGTFQDILSGGVSRVRRNLARVDALGALDPDFDPRPDQAATAIVLQADGKMLVAGNFLGFNLQIVPGRVERPYLARLNNAPATSSFYAASSAEIVWQLGGSSPQVQRAAFELSTDDGGSWTFLGDAAWVAADGQWKLDGLSLPVSGRLRARGDMRGGIYTASGGAIEAQGVIGIRPEPEITVAGAGVTIANGSATPSTTNDTDFGAVTGSGTVVKSYTITNDGTRPLHLQAVQVTGSSAFSISSQSSASTLSPGAATSFGLTFTPQTAGLHAATVSFVNDDADESPFTFAIQGAAVTAPTVAGPGSSSVASNSATLGGTVVTDGASPILQRGVVFSKTADNSAPILGGLGAVTATVAGDIGSFAIPVSGLTDSTSYSYRAFATNLIGTSYSAVDGFTTSRPITVPGAPVIGTAVARSGGVSVTFTAPADDGGASIFDYEATCGASYITTGITSPIVVTGIPDNSTLTCSVKARNSSGFSAASAASNSVTTGALQVELTTIPADGPEGDSGMTTRAFVLTKTGAGATVVSFSLSGSATYTEDYTISGTGVNATSGQVTFAAATTTRTITVSVKGDTKYEALDRETIGLTLTGITNGALGAVTSGETGITSSQDVKPSIRVAVANGNEGANALVTVTLSNKTYQTVSFDATTVNGTALSGDDFTSTTILKSTPAGQIAPDTLNTTFTVPLRIDNLDEPNETYSVVLSNFGLEADADPLGRTTDAGTIVDIDLPPTVSIAPSSVVEGNSLTSPMTFTLTLSAPSGKTITVRAGTIADATPGASQAVPPGDYVATPATTTITFSPGSTTQTYSVTVKGDTTPEPNETFAVQLTNPNANVDFTTGVHLVTGTILNDDSLALSVSDPILSAEGNSGTTNLVFTVSMASPAPAGGVGFTFATSDGTGLLGAIAGSDYTTTSGTVTGTSGGILAGSNSTTITVPVLGDTVVEGHETFKLTVSAPTNGATLLKTFGVGTIRNDDSVPIGSLLISEFRQNGPGGINDEYVEIFNPTVAPVVVFTTDGSNGFSVAKSDGGNGTAVFTIPNGTTIPSRGHYLGANSLGYSLTSFASSDVTWASDIADDSGLALFPTSDSFNYATATPLDAVGFAAHVGTKFAEGTTPALTPAGAGPFTKQYAFVRKYVYGGGAIQDSSNSGVDFTLVAVDPLTYGGPMGAVLGGPSPENAGGGTERAASAVSMGLVDPTASQYAMPHNYAYVPAVAGVNGNSIELRRLLTNNTGAPLSGLRLKASSLSTLNGNAMNTQADFRPAASTTLSTPTGDAVGLALEGAPNYTLTIDGPAVMGGLNTILRVPTVTPATPLSAVSGSNTVGVNFKLFYTTNGLPGYFWVTVEAK